MKMCIFRYSFIERMLVLMCSENACNKRTIKKQFSLINSFVYNDYLLNHVQVQKITMQKEHRACPI